MSPSDTPTELPRPPDLSAAGAAELARVLGGLDQLARVLTLLDRPDADGDVPLGRYRLRRRIGEGRFGVVFLADDPRLGRRVVVKVPQPAVLADPAVHARFVREARAAARLDHPGVVPVYEAGEDRGLTYLAAAYVDGPTLEAWMRARPGPADPAVAARLVRVLAEAVHHAHERGVLHCDLKPANVLLDRSGDGPNRVPGVGVPRATDFGLARVLDDDPGLTRTMGVAGTALYMAPEQARGERRGLTARADVYALGSILYELLTGRPPFGGNSEAEVTVRLLAEPPAPPRRLNRSAPRDLEAVCLRCLEKDPADRYASADALAADLGRFLAGRPTEARPVGPATRAWRAARRRPVLAGLLLQAGVALAALPAVGTWYSLRLEAEAAARRQAERDAERDRELSAAGAFFAALDRVRVRRVERSPGWPAANLADLRRLAASPPAAGRRAVLRSEAAVALGSVDLGEPRVVAPGFLAYAPAFRPDGRELAAGGWRADDGGRVPVRLVDPATGADVRTLTFEADREWEARDGRGSTDGCRSLAYSPDGRWLVAGARSGRLVRWDLHRADPAAVVWRHAPPSADTRGEWVRRVAFTPSGRVLVSAGGREAAGWDADRGWAEAFRRAGNRRPAQVVRPAGPTDPVRFVVDAAGFRAGDGPPSVEPAVGFPEVLAAARGGAWSVYESPARGHLEVGAERGTTDFACGGWLRLPAAERAEDGDVTDAAAGPDGELLATCAEHQGHLKLWSVASGEVLSARVATGASLRLAFGPGGRTLAVAGAAGVLLYDLPRSGASEALAVGAVRLADADVTPDGGVVAAVGTTAATHRHRDPGLYVSRWADGGRTLVDWRETPLPASGNEHLVAASPDGRRLLFASGPNVRAAGESFGGTHASLAAHGLDEVRFGPDGRAWGVGTDGLLGWDRVGEADAPPVVVYRPPAGVSYRCVCPAAGEVWAGRDDGAVCRHRPTGGPPDRTHRVFETAVVGVARSADGRRVAAGDATGVVRVVDADSGRVVVGLSAAHRDGVPAVAFLLGGGLVTGSRDQTVKLWDASGREVLTLPQTGPVRRVFASADGTTLTLLAEGERGLRRWHLDRLRAELAELGLDW